jgi:hypothetical protein
MRVLAAAAEARGRLCDAGGRARAGRAREREGERARRETAAAGRGSTGSRDSMSPSPTRGRRGVLSLDAREETESRLEMESYFFPLSLINDLPHQQTAYMAP